MSPAPYRVVVPAVMGVGVLFSLATLLRDVVHRGRLHGGFERRVAASAAVTAAVAVRGLSSAGRATDGLRPRIAAVASGVACLAFSGYLIVGASWNYANPVNQFRGMATLWALGMTLAAAAGMLGAAFLVAAARWRNLPPPVRPLMYSSPLTALSPSRSQVPRGLLLAGVAAAAGGLSALTVVVRTIGQPTSLDRSLAEFAHEFAWMRHLRWLTPLSGPTGVLAAVLLPLAAWLLWRCRARAVVFTVSTFAAWRLPQLLNSLVGRPAASSESASGTVPSYVDSELVVAAVLIGLVPAVLTALLRLTWVGWVSTTVLAAGLVGLAMEKVLIASTWPLEVAGSLLFGVALVLLATAGGRSDGLHRRCRCGRTVSRESSGQGSGPALDVQYPNLVPHIDRNADQDVTRRPG